MAISRWLKRVLGTAAYSTASRRRPILRVGCLEDRTLLSVTLVSNYHGLGIDDTQGWVPPDTCGAVGPTNYVETVNQNVAIFSPKASGTTVTNTYLPTFWYTTGGLHQTDSGSFLSDPIVVYDDQIGRFIVGDQDVDFNTHLSNFDFAVSKSSSPSTLGTADWNFYQISTTQTNADADYPGNFGYNHDAWVFTLNMFPVTGSNYHVQVVSVNSSDLSNGVSQAQLHVFKNNVSTFSLRATVMHDSVAGDPMWLVAEHGNNASIDVYKMTNVLSNSASFAVTNLAVTPYSGVAAPRNPDGSAITTNIDSRIMKSAEWNNTIVAAHAVGVSGTQDAAQWYKIDVSSGTPALSDEGRVSAGANTYVVYPTVDINSAGQIGMTYIRSGRDSSSDYMSMWITGRVSSDPAGQMETPVLVPSGTGNGSDNGDGREGDLSGINVDPTDGSFWAANEWADNGTVYGVSWGTAVANFTFGSTLTIGLSGTTLQITDTSGSANISVRLKAGDSTTLEVVSSGTVAGSFATSSFTNIAVTLNGSSNQFTVDGSNGDPVPSGGVSFIGNTATNTLIVNDAADSTTRTITMSAISPTGTISGSNAGAITYTLADVSGVTLDTGTASDTVNVQSTASSTTTNIVGASNLTVNVGNAGSVQGIAGGAHAEQYQRHHRTDHQRFRRQHQLHRHAGGHPAHWHGPSDDKLYAGPAQQPYPGHRHWCRHRQRPGYRHGVPTSVIGAAALTVNVGDAGFTQNIFGALTLGNTSGTTTLTVDDSADSNIYNVTLTPSQLTGLTAAADQLHRRAGHIVHHRRRYRGQHLRRPGHRRRHNLRPQCRHRQRHHYPGRHQQHPGRPARRPCHQRRQRQGHAQHHRLRPVHAPGLRPRRHHLQPHRQRHRVVCQPQEPGRHPGLGRQYRDGHAPRRRLRPRCPAAAAAIRSSGPMPPLPGPSTAPTRARWEPS